ncbi:MAG: hypothetical protein QM644_05350 [Mobilitalea sp.]
MNINRALLDRDVITKKVMMSFFNIYSKVHGGAAYNNLFILKEDII